MKFNVEEGAVNKCSWGQKIPFGSKAFFLDLKLLVYIRNIFGFSSVIFRKLRKFEENESDPRLILGRHLPEC